MAWVKLDKFKVTEFRNGAVFRTVKLDSEWFPINKQPPLYKPDQNGIMFVAGSGTDVYHFGRDKPNP